MSFIGDLDGLAQLAWGDFTQHSVRRLRHDSNDALIQIRV